MWVHLGLSGKLDEAKNFSEHPVNEERKVFAFSDVSASETDCSNSAFSRRMGNG